ncbi:hypothetical protein [Symbioplanes lichenis]|uniref:hypothetical protein n=1 Tax=Symbioplanes lichenis TaxID=1629072 RepID=UPI0027393E6B|nr:hypothetical protein [Actinoplanes lichenis]
MIIDAVRVASFRLPVGYVSALTPRVPGRRLIVAGVGAAVAVFDVDRAAAGPLATFPQPGEPTGDPAVAPDLSLAVWPGLTAVHAVAANGTAVWTARHPCRVCGETHESADEYADDLYHRSPDSGSAAFAADGRTVWAHVRGDLLDAPAPPGPPPADDDSTEQWVVFAAADGSVLARTGTESWGAGSDHLPHLDPAVMGLDIGEGQDGSVVLVGRLREDGLETVSFDDRDRILVALGPDHVLTVRHGGPTDLRVHRLTDLGVTAELASADLPGSGPENGWDYYVAPLDDRTYVASTSRHGHAEDDIRHWLIDVVDGVVRGQVRYPGAAGPRLIGFGDGTWLTAGPESDVALWRLPPSIS